MENTVHSDELQHWGIKGQKWGVRRYQNPDGSLTKAGQKRYNKEVEKLKKETAKVKEAEKAAATRKKTQSKLDKLEAAKAKLEERKKALKDNPDGKKEDKPEETPEQRKERLLKSTNPKELYEGKDDLSSQELTERVNRIDLEQRLQSKIPKEESKSAADYMEKASKNIDKATALYKSVDSAYSTVTNSAIGKTLAKQLGIEPPKKEYDIREKWKNRKYLNSNEFQELANRIENEKKGSRGLQDLDDDKKPATKFEDLETFNKNIHDKTYKELDEYAKALKDADYLRGIEEKYKRAAAKATGTP